MKKTKALPLIISGVAVVLVAVIVLLIVIIKPGSSGGSVADSIIKDIKFEKQGKTYEKFEISFNIDKKFNNPYDPYEVEVNGIFTYPNGKKAVVPAFYIVPMKFTSQKTVMSYNANSYYPNGDAHWCIRFSGMQKGNYSFTIQVKTKDMDYKYERTQRFELTDSKSKGFLEISEDNPLYFQNSGDGSLFYGTGSNIAWVRAPFTKDPEHMSYDYFIGQQKKYGINLTRVWLCHWAWLEWMPNSKDSSTASYAGLGRYNQCISSALDKIFVMLEDADIRMILTLDDNNEQFENSDGYDTWKYNPYNAANGGPAESLSDYWRNEKVREYYKKRLRYIVARWGYSTSLASINLWNDQTTPNEDIVDYLDELCQYTEEISEDWRPLLFASNFTSDANDVLDYYTQTGGGEGADKPRVIQECGYPNSMENFKQSLRNTVWNEMFSNTACTMIWSHDDVDESDSWDVFTSMNEFSKDLYLHKYEYVTEYEEVESAGSALQAKYDSTGTGFKTVTVHALGDVASWAQKATKNEFEIYDTDNDMMLAGISPKLYGTNAGVLNFRNNPTFIVDCMNGGEMVVNIAGVGGGTNTVTAMKDGKKIKEIKITGKVQADQKYFTIPLEPGINEITLSNEGNDWLEVKAYYFKFNLDSNNSVAVRRLISEKQQLALIQNTRNGEVYTDVFGGKVAVATEVKVPFYELADGKYKVQVYNTETREYITSEEVTVSGGEYIIDIPEVSHIVAAKITKID